MPDRDEAAALARECMVDSQSRAAAIAKPRHVQRFQVVPQAQIVPKLLGGQDVAVKQLRVTRESSARLRSAVGANGEPELLPLKLRGVCLLIRQADVLGVLRHLPHLRRMPPAAEIALAK